MVGKGRLMKSEEYIREDVREIKEAIIRVESKMDNHLERIAKLETKVQNQGLQIKAFWALFITSISGLSMSPICIYAISFTNTR